MPAVEEMEYDLRQAGLRRESVQSPNLMAS
jgi:hypothetical protein